MLLILCDMGNPSVIPSQRASNAESVVKFWQVRNLRLPFQLFVRLLRKMAFVHAVAQKVTNRIA